MTHPKVLIVLAVGLLVAGGLGWVGREQLRATATGRPWPGQAQMLSADEGRQTAFSRTDIGQRVVFGANVLHNPGPGPVTLTSGELAGEVSPRDAEVVEVRVFIRGDDEDTPLLIGAGPWPNEDLSERSKPLAGTVLAPGHEAELLYIVEPKSEGTWRWPRTEVRYLQDDRERMASTDFGYAVCVPSTADCDLSG